MHDDTDPARTSLTVLQWLMAQAPPPPKHLAAIPTLEVDVRWRLHWAQRVIDMTTKPTKHPS